MARSAVSTRLRKMNSFLEERRCASCQIQLLFNFGYIIDNSSMKWRETERMPLKVSRSLLMPPISLLVQYKNPWGSPLYLLNQNYPCTYHIFFKKTSFRWILRKDWPQLCRMLQDQKICCEVRDIWNILTILFEVTTFHVTFQNATKHCSMLEGKK